MEEFTPKRIVIHCAATRDGSYISVDEIRKWHIARGFKDIGYHFLVEPDGAVLQGRPLMEAGAHVEGANKDSLGVCLIGNALFTTNQFVSLKAKVKELCSQFTIPEWEIYGHYEFPSAKKQGKTCPNIRIANLLAYVFGDKLEAIQQYLIKESK